MPVKLHAEKQHKHYVPGLRAEKLRLRFFQKVQRCCAANCTSIWAHIRRHWNGRGCGWMHVYVPQKGGDSPPEARILQQMQPRSRKGINRWGIQLASMCIHLAWQGGNFNWKQFIDYFIASFVGNSRLLMAEAQSRKKAITMVFTIYISG